MDQSHTVAFSRVQLTQQDAKSYCQFLQVAVIRKIRLTCQY